MREMVFNFYDYELGEYVEERFLEKTLDEDCYFYPFNYQFPRREGYRFRGYQCGDALSIQTDSDDENHVDRLKIMENTTFVAQYEQLPDVTFDAGEGVFRIYDEDLEESVEQKTYITTPNESGNYISGTRPQDGKDIGLQDISVVMSYTIDYDDENYKKRDLYNVTENLTFVAQYEKLPWVTFDANGGQYRYWDYEKQENIVADKYIDYSGEEEVYLWNHIPELEGAVFTGYKCGDTEYPIHMILTITGLIM